MTKGTHSLQKGLVLGLGFPGKFLENAKARLSEQAAESDSKDGGEDEEDGDFE